MAENGFFFSAAHRVAETKYGENPQQESYGVYADSAMEDPLSIPRNFIHRMGDVPSFNNYAVIDNMLQTATHIAAAMDKNGHEVPNIALGFKHKDACGASINDDQPTAVVQMVKGGPIPIHGGNTMFNFKLTAELADLLIHHGIEEGQTKRLIDVVTASDIDHEAVSDILERKGGKLRVLTNEALGSLSLDSLDASMRKRPIRGGFLAQENYVFVPDMHSEQWLADNGEADLELERMLLMAWAIGSTASSNTITIVKNGMLVGNGVGEQDRVAAATQAVWKAHRAGHDTTGATAYSDSFFPFPDGPEVLADAGITNIFTSSGSVNDPQVFAAMEKRNVRVFHAPDKQIRGFYGH